MQPNDPNEPGLDVRYRTILILWAAICMSVLMFLVLVQFTPAPATDNVKLSLILNSAGIVPLGMSFLLKQIVHDRAVSQQNLQLVQTGYVLAFALCEVAALLGLLDHFVNGSRYYYLGFVLAGLGLLAHFPRMKPLLDAAPRQF